MAVKSQRLADLMDFARVTDCHGILVTKDIAGRTIWDGLAETAPTVAVISAEDEAAAWTKSAEQIEQLERLVTKSTVLLDLGCGYGRIAQYLLPKKQLGGYVGVDSAYAMLRLFKDRYDASEDERRTPALLLNSDISRMPLKPASVDLAFTSAVFLHNHKSVVREAIKEVERVLKPGGTLIALASFPRRATALGLQGAAYQAFLNLIGRALRNGPVRYYSKRQVADLFSNFSQVTIIPSGFTFVPKSLMGIGGLPERLFRTALANPVNSLLERTLPRRTHQAFATHYDVIARK